MQIIDVDTILGSDRLPIVDVRSPGEFAKGHIPGAHNIPLFDDAERAEVGTLYKQVGRVPAVDRGLEIATGKADQLVHATRQLAVDTEFSVHCWRGGMRSEGFAWLCHDCGLKPRVLQGGYKSFRQAAHDSFAVPHLVVVLAGNTGAGKTKLLWELSSVGQQMVDLEGLANHRGSAFGGIGQPPQPTAEQFENDLFLQWRELDASKPVWIEGESRSIGKVQIPQSIWDQMCAAPMIFVEVDRQQRVEFLVQEYGSLPADELAAAMQRIGKRLGGDRLQSALDALERGDVSAVAAAALQYYDKTYTNSLARHDPDTVYKVPMNRAADPEAVGRLVEAGKRATRATADSAAVQSAKPVSVENEEPATDFTFRI